MDKFPCFLISVSGTEVNLIPFLCFTIHHSQELEEVNEKNINFNSIYYHAKIRFKTNYI
jgi:hypothetical protein